jgi:hypothetical protein
MEELAKQYVIDNVGKNNYVNTLSDAPVASFPPGFVLKHEKKDDIPAMCLSYINQIYILYTTKIETGRIWSNVRMSVSVRGYFALDTIDASNLPTEVQAVSVTSAKRTVSLANETTLGYNNVIQELMKFNRNKLRRASESRSEDNILAMLLPSFQLMSETPPPPLTLPPPPPPLPPIYFPTIPPPPPLPPIYFPTIPPPPPLPVKRSYSSDGLEEVLPPLEQCIRII